MFFIYDITRLVAKVDAPTPSGIDRVDIQYANSIANSEYKAHFVCIVSGVFCYVETNYAKSLIQYLYNKWILGNDFKFKKKDIAPKSASKAFSFSSRKNNFKIIDEKLFEVLSGREKDGFYVNTSHYGVGKVDAYYLFKTLGNIKIVFFLHDLIPIDFPEYVNEGDKEQHEIRVKAMSQFSDLVIVNSIYTKNRLFEYCNKNGIKTPNCVVNFIGTEQKFINHSNQSSDKKLDFDYFIYVSTIEARKNHIMLLNLWREIVTEYGQQAPKLLLIGKSGWKNEAAIDMINRCEIIQSHVKHLTGIADEELIKYLKNAKALLFPSFVEGWGMPLVEAMTMKTPVICSDLSVFHEAGQELAIYISPIDSAQWKEEILKFANDDGYREHQIHRLKKFQIPTWDSHFRIFYNTLNDLNATPGIEIKKESISQFKLFLQKNQTSKNTKIKKIPTVYDRSRLIQKFRRNPKQYLMDSKHRILRFIGSLI